MLLKSIYVGLLSMKVKKLEKDHEIYSSNDYFICF